MNWKKQFNDWKLVWALVLILLICGEAAPHVELRVPDFVPSTTVEIQITGGQVSNVTAGVYSWSSHPWITR